ncbi:hypothetical protein GGS21DRAFT_116573 [Xylaria nigripes]|nr:hypothetical protein GGS21DRAFT_116573 [Xylaria nigripes]
MASAALVVAATTKMATTTMASVASAAQATTRMETTTGSRKTPAAQATTKISSHHTRRERGVCRTAHSFHAEPAIIMAWLLVPTTSAFDFFPCYLHRYRRWHIVRFLHHHFIISFEHLHRWGRLYEYD